jgi:hypothetical protein
VLLEEEVGDAGDDAGFVLADDGEGRELLHARTLKRGSGRGGSPEEGGQAGSRSSGVGRNFSDRRC